MSGVRRSQHRQSTSKSAVQSASKSAVQPVRALNTQETPKETPKETPEISMPSVPKKKGRPAGSKDKAPRKPVVRVKVEPIKSEPIKEAPPEIEETSKKSEVENNETELPKPKEPLQDFEIEEPPSPRTQRMWHAREGMRLRGIELQSKHDRLHKHLFERASMANIF